MKLTQLYQKFIESSGVSTDTRTLKKDTIYFALKGDNFDGNKFVSQAIENGAKYCVVDDKVFQDNSNCILVENTLVTLQQLATYHRHQISIPIISLTGSNGKTTTKELIYNALKTQYNVKATHGNLNNHIGVPLTLLSFTKNLDFGIVEMGANHQKEIEFLSAIAQPDFGLITNFGKAHLEGFGSVEGIIKGKSELYDFLRENNKTVFINTDDEKQVAQIKSYSSIITFGEGNTNKCIINFKSANPFVAVHYKGVDIISQLVGDFNYGNIAVAIAVADYFKVSIENIKKAIENYIPNNNRSQIIKKRDNTIILDAYNANPTSMMAALKNFKQLEATNKYLFLGDMFELGDAASKEHQNIVDYVESNIEANIYIVGQHFFDTTSKSNKLESFEDLKPLLKNITIKNSTILIKGSRGMALERILDFI